MKTAEVRRLLRMSQARLDNYRVQGNVQAKLLINGRYEYDERSGFARLKFFHLLDAIHKKGE